MATFPIGGPYATLAQLKVQMGIPDSNTARDVDLTRKLASSAQDINLWCHRQFGRAESATTRRFRAGPSGVDVHDFWTEDDLVITPYSMGQAGTAWDLAQVTLEPLDGVVNQVPGWPYTRICLPYADHPLYVAAIRTTGYEVRVTAKWGWEITPENITTSNLMLAAMDDKAKDAPFGVAAFGDFATRIRSNPMVQEKLEPYRLGGSVAQTVGAEV